MILNFVFYANILSIVLSVTAVIYSYSIYRYNRLAKMWLFLTWGFILIVVLRLFLIALGFGMFSSLKGISSIIEVIVRNLISLFFVLGLWGMKHNFEDFDLISKRVKSKVRKIRK